MSRIITIALGYFIFFMSLCYVPLIVFTASYGMLKME